MWTDPLGLVCKERYERYKALRNEGYSVQDATSLSRAKRIDDPDRLLPAPNDPGARVNADKVSVIVDENAFLKYYAARDGEGNLVFDNNGNLKVASDAKIPPGKYVTFTEDISGMNITQARNATGTYSVPGRTDYRAYENQNYRVDIDFSQDKDSLSIPDLNPDYLNDIGGPRAVGGARQRTLNRTVDIGGKVENVSRYDVPIKPTPE